MAARKKTRSKQKPVPAKKKTGATSAKGKTEDEVLSMDEAIALVKTTRPTFYRWLRAGKIKGMKAGRQWRFYRKDIEHFLKGEAPRIELPVSVGPLIEELLERARDMGIKSLSAPINATVAAAIDLVISLGAELTASDIHLEPFSTSAGGETVGMIRYRIDGVLQPVVEFDLRLMPALIEHLKSAAACDVREKLVPQDGRILLEAGERKLDLRICFTAAMMGESATIRIMDSSVVVLDLERIDYAPHDRERLLKALRSPWGLILVTGPTGCGKTTVLYSCLNELAGPETKTMSLEDPVEYLLPWVTQIGIKEVHGRTFAHGARAILRSAPNVIMIGEIRDRETLTICQKAALTGHMVLTTMHADEAASTLKRMIEIGSEPFIVAESARLVTAQRLVRKLCPECSQPHDPSPEALSRASTLARSGGLGWETLKPEFRKPVGCARCGRTGFRGRTIITEVMEVTPEIGKAVRREATVEEIRAVAVSQGMTTMAADGIRRAAAGQVLLTEVLHNLGMR
jgi:excisionase family DNA binding protein